MELIDYLSANYFSEAQLLAVSGIDAAALRALQHGGMMPQPSYRLHLQQQCDSYFGRHAAQNEVHYYARGYAPWIGLLQTLAGPEEAFRVFAERYRTRLHQLKLAGLCSGDAKLNAGLDGHLQEEWRHFLDGTYGLCTKTGLPEDIAAKELATRIIEEIIGAPDGQVPTGRERVCLTLAVDLLDTASSQFAPHERGRSSRHRLIDEVRKTYRL